MNNYKNSESLSWQFAFWLLEKAQVAVVWNGFRPERRRAFSDEFREKKEGNK